MTTRSALESAGIATVGAALTVYIWTQLPMPSEEDGPDELTALGDGDLYVFHEEDIAELASQVFAFSRELEGMNDSRASELADMTYELFTEGYVTQSTDTDTDSDYKVK